MSFLLTDSEYEIRKSTCKGCDKYRKTLDQCGQCGCFLKAKARLKNQKCPLNKWNV